MAENIENNGCSQRDNAEHEGYAKASRSFNRIWKERDSAQPRLLEAILYKDSMKNNIDDINGWLYHRIRMCIWKQWKKPRTKARNLIKMGVPEDLAMQAGNTRRGHWFATHTVAVNMAMTKERLINSGFYDLATAYQSVHDNY